VDSDSEDEGHYHHQHQHRAEPGVEGIEEERERDMRLARKFVRRWIEVVGIEGGAGVVKEHLEGECCHIGLRGLRRR